jgi:hypothetical protein
MLKSAPPYKVSCFLYYVVTTNYFVYQITLNVAADSSLFPLIQLISPQPVVSPPSLA